jgi:probable HAF family extracellular repeat protein
MTMRTAVLVAASALAASVWVDSGTTALAASRYSVEDIGALPGSDVTAGYGINVSGNVTGWSAPSRPGSGVSGFVWNGSTMRPLGSLPGFSTSTGLAINVAGQVTGYAGSLYSQAFLWNGSTMRALPPLPGDAGLSSVGQGMNDLGHVVGCSGRPTRERAVYWSGTTVRNLGTLPGHTRSMAFDVNNSGVAVGESGTDTSRVAVVFRGGTVIRLGFLPGGTTTSRATAVNAAGHVAGWSDSSAGFRAFLWNGSVMTSLGTLPGHGSSLANDMNSGGQIVGVSNGTESKAFIWEAGVMYDLTSRILPSDPLYGVIQLSAAQAINEVGQIISFGGRPGGPLHTYLLTPSN